MHSAALADLISAAGFGRRDQGDEFPIAPLMLFLKGECTSGLGTVYPVIRSVGTALHSLSIVGKTVYILIDLVILFDDLRITIVGSLYNESEIVVMLVGFDSFLISAYGAGAEPIILDTIGLMPGPATISVGLYRPKCIAVPTAAGEPVAGGRAGLYGKTVVMLGSEPRIARPDGVSLAVGYHTPVEVLIIHRAARSRACSGELCRMDSGRVVSAIGIYGIT